MGTSVHHISWVGVFLAFIPTGFVMGLLWRWTNDGRHAVYALGRMLGQLVVVGYILTFIFTADHPGIITLVLGVMLIAASWIALRSVQHKGPGLFGKALLAIFIGVVPSLVLVTQVILQITPWFFPQYLIPLAGMLFASSMNTVSLAAERFEAEFRQVQSYLQARETAFAKSLIPLTNTLLAVGLVSLPGMMTGQILAGVSPLIAAKYQIVIMALLFGVSGISAALYLLSIKDLYPPQQERVQSS